MIGTAATFFAASIGIFVLVLFVVRQERKNKQRFFAGKIRGSLDKWVLSVEAWILKSWEHFVKFVLQLNWYYSLHSLLKTILKALQAFYFSFEKVFERNRARTKKLRAERRQISEVNHLRQMSHHKEETALTDSQKKKLRHKKLEEKH